MSKAMITVSGFLAAPAQVKQVGEDAVCEFSIAHNRKERGEEHTDWYRMSVWGKRATAVAPFLTKGKGVMVMGDLAVRTYQKDGETRVALEVRVSELDFLGGGDRDQQQAAPAPQQQRAAAPAPQQAPRQVSPDGRFEWDGATWVPRAQAAPPPPPSPPPPPVNGYAPPPPPQEMRRTPF